MNPLRQCWTIIRLLYLYIGYWLVGLPQEYFYIKKGNYFVDLKWYHRAIRNYKKALQDSDDPHIHSMLGYCYSQIGTPVDSVEHYSKAHDKIRDPKTDLGLAISEVESGNIEKSEEIIFEVSRSSYQLEPSDVETLDWLRLRIEIAKKGRKDLKHSIDELKQK
jgi:tetratricopeptide (TPR) repeat protein